MYRAMLSSMLPLSAVETPALSIGLKKVRHSSAKRSSLHEKVDRLKHKKFKIVSVGNLERILSCVRTSFAKTDVSAQPGRPAKPWCKIFEFYVLKNEIPKPLLVQTLAFFPKALLDRLGNIFRTASSAAYTVVCSLKPTDASYRFDGINCEEDIRTVTSWYRCSFPKCRYGQVHSHKARNKNHCVPPRIANPVHRNSVLKRGLYG